MTPLPVIAGSREQLPYEVDGYDDIAVTRDTLDTGDSGHPVHLQPRCASIINVAAPVHCELAIVRQRASVTARACLTGYDDDPTNRCICWWSSM